FTSTSSRPKVATVFSTAALTASTSAASAWIATAFPPSSSIALTTAEAALASFAYVMATLAPSAARRLAMAAPMPREPPVTRATFWLSFDIWSPLPFRSGISQAASLTWHLCKQIRHFGEYLLFRKGMPIVSHRTDGGAIMTYRMDCVEERVGCLNKLDAMQIFV